LVKDFASEQHPEDMKLRLKFFETLLSIFDQTVLALAGSIRQTSFSLYTGS